MGPSDYCSFISIKSRKWIISLVYIAQESPCDVDIINIYLGVAVVHRVTCLAPKVPLKQSTERLGILRGLTIRSLYTTSGVSITHSAKRTRNWHVRLKIPLGYIFERKNDQKLCCCSSLWCLFIKKKVYICLPCWRNTTTLKVRKKCGRKKDWAIKKEREKLFINL